MSVRSDTGIFSAITISQCFDDRSGVVGSIFFRRNDLRFSGQHVCSSALAGIAHIGISLHVPHYRVRCYGNVDHGRSAPWADGFVNCIRRRHEL
jgi:hypothetical protein